MNFLNIITTIGVASVVVGLLYIGRKLQILDDLKSVTDKIKLNIKVVSDFLTRNNANFNHSELQAYSPRVFMYNKPDRNMENTAPTLGVYIRDMYLSEHPEIIE